MTKPLELTGKIFGRLTVIERVESNSEGKSRWKCVCKCGNNHITTGSRLKTGKVNSCGCIQKEAAKLARTKHGLSSHPLYAVRKEMVARTTNPNNSHYIHYGARGITVCAEWLNKKNGIKNFYDWSMMNGYKEGLSIDRINNDGNYEPNNCRWVDNYVQANNKRANHLLTYEGKTQNIKQWTDELEVSVGLISDRIKWGWSVEKALTTPVRKINKK